MNSLLFKNTSCPVCSSQIRECFPCLREGSFRLIREELMGFTPQGGAEGFIKISLQQFLPGEVMKQVMKVIKCLCPRGLEVYGCQHASCQP